MPRRPSRRTWFVLTVALAVVLGFYWVDRNIPRPLRLHGLQRQDLGAELLRLDAKIQRGHRELGAFMLFAFPPQALEIAIHLNPEKRPLVSLLGTADLVVNGSFFTDRHQATGLLLSQGQRLSRFISSGGPGGSGVLVLAANQISLLARDDLDTKRLKNADLAIQAGPRIIEAGGEPGIRSDNGKRANRSFLGKDQQGRLVVGVVYDQSTARTGGITLFELQELLLKGLPKATAGLQIDALLNLDGGPSTGLITRLGGQRALEESAPILSYLAIRVRSGIVRSALSGVDGVNGL